MKKNDRVPGLNGLMFAYYKDDGGSRIMVSVQWFENGKDLQAFFDSNIAQQLKIPEQKGLKKRKFEGSVIWSNGTQAHYWTDGRNLMCSEGGESVPDELVEAYLKRIPSKVAEIGDKKEAKR